MQPLFLGAESLFVWRVWAGRSLRLSDTAAVGASLSTSFPRLKMASVHFGFFLTKNLPAAPNVLLIHFWQVEKRSVTGRKTPQGQQVAGSGAGGAGRAGCAGAVCPSHFPPVLPVLGCSCTSRAGLSAGPRRAPSLTWGCLQHSPSLPIVPSRDAPAHRSDGQASSCYSLEIALPLHRLHPL